MDEMIFLYDEDIKSERLDVWLTSKLSQHSRSYVQRIIQNGNVVINGRTAKLRDKLVKGDEVCLLIPETQILDIIPQNIPIDIVYEDNDIIVVNKPKNMVVHPAVGNYSGTLVNALMYHCGENLSDINGVKRPGIVHRIDKDTTGLICIAKNNNAHQELSDQLKCRSMKRTYIALVEGVINENNGIINVPIGRNSNDRKKRAVTTDSAKEAITRFKVLERFSKYTLIEVSLETGRTHQIRVHMSYIRHPICGDEMYGKKFAFCETNGQALHAYKLELIHPSTKENKVFERKVPDYFKNILDILRVN